MDPQLNEREFEWLRRLIYSLSGISLSENKKHLLTSRLTRRLRALRLESFRDYCYHLRTLAKDDPEMEQLINCVTTNKTDFFREPHHFDFVKSHLIPESTATGRIRAWHAGCSSGEEAYTLAMTFHEAIPDINHWTIEQYASDIDTKILATAAAGLYDEARLDPVPPALKAKYFQRGKGSMEGKVRVRPFLQDHLEFSQVNLLAEDWGVKGPFDLIMCRNVMIYFDKPTQATLVERFKNLLRPGGYLMVGHSESLNGIEAGLSSLGKTIYQRPSAASALPVRATSALSAVRRQAA